jgi:hypothetical protein
MSFDPPEGILDIGNATLRVGKLEVAETSGLNQGLLNIVKNDLLITENTEYASSNTWGIKLPTTWVAEFDVKGHSTTKYVEFNFYNEDKTSNALGYLLNFKDTTLSLMYDTSLSEDQNILATATIPTIVDTYRKVNIFFERGVISVSIDGTQYLYHKETDGYNQGLGVASRVVSATGGAFVNLFIEENAANSKFKNLRIVNDRFISDKTSNIAFMGGNLGVGVNSPQEALDIRGNMHFRGSPTSQIKVDSNVVTEYTGPHDRPLRKYPEVLSPGTGLVPVSVTTPFTGLKQSWNGYEIIMSSRWDTSGEYNGDHAFDDNESSIWLSGNSPATYDSNGDATSEDTLDGVDGSYLIMKLPKAIKPSYANIKTRAANDFAPRHPKTGKFYGSNDGSSWTEIGTFSYGSIPSSVYYQKFNLVGTNTYQYIAIQVHTVFNDSGPSDGTTNGVVILDLQYYGHEEGSGSLDTTLKSVYNVPATTGTQLEVYYDGQDYTGVTSMVNDKAGTATNATISNAGGTITFNDEYKAWTFGGDTTRTDTFTSPISSSIQGNIPLSASLWFKTSELNSGSLISLAPSTGEATNQVFGVRLDSSTETDFSFLFWNNDIRYSIPENTLIKDNWYHLTATYDGTNRNLYVNGVRLTVVSTFGANLYDDLALPSSNLQLQLGRRNNGDNEFFGSIANFRLYSKALNAGQVKELYDYQKDYFLGSKSQVTLYKGHLGVGVTEPSGQLELAGDERIQEYPPGPMMIMRL